MEGAGIGLYIVFIVAAIIFIWLFFYFIPLGLWFSAIFANVRVPIFSLIGMRIRKVPPGIILNALINSTKAGLVLNQDDLEAHYLAGGNVRSVVNALISADKANIDLDFKAATAIDLAGRMY
jgi:uncharacterized protein YqfA (UPF0365 family)